MLKRYKPFIFAIQLIVAAAFGFWVLWEVWKVGK